MSKHTSAEQNRLGSYGDPDKEGYYDQWAGTYDEDLKSEGYAGPEHAAALLASILPVDSSVMDFGCGSGLVGENLASLGYTELYGVDISQRMLEQAASRDCYRSLRQHDITTAMIDDIRYQAGICVGVCSFGPVTADDIVNMTAVLHAGAPLVLTINGIAWEEKNWAEQLDEAQTKHGFTIEYINTIPFLVEKGIDAKLLIIRNQELETTEPWMDENTSSGDLFSQ